MRFEGTKRTVFDGPFAETKELVAGFCIWQVKSKDEAVEWLKRAPFEEGEVELRQIYDVPDLAVSDEVRKRDAALRQVLKAKSS